MSRHERVRAAVVGIAGPGLLPEEDALLRRLPPAGVILFARNCVDRGQLRRLTDAVRATQTDRRLPILIDQEGGRVARLKAPHWRRLPAAGVVGANFRNEPENAREAARLLGRLVAHDVAEVGIDVACAPVVDVARPETTGAIGDRAFSNEPETVAELAGCFARGLMAGGVAPVLKHLPGHGRARVDSHHELPVVDAGPRELAATDLLPARRLRHLPLAMTAHVLYREVDPNRPGTLSPTVIRYLIRGVAGFEGILFSDDIAMKALCGAPGEIALEALAAGCDVALACTGDMAESEAVLASVPPLPKERLTLLDAAVRPGDGLPFDPDEAWAVLHERLGTPVA